MDRQLGIQLGEGGFKEILVIFLDVFCPLLLQDLVFGGPFSCKKGKMLFLTIMEYA